MYRYHIQFKELYMMELSVRELRITILREVEKIGRCPVIPVPLFNTRSIFVIISFIV
jgi:hypothetical protein